MYIEASSITYIAFFFPSWQLLRIYSTTPTSMPSLVDEINKVRNHVNILAGLNIVVANKKMIDWRDRLIDWQQPKKTRQHAVKDRRRCERPTFGTRKWRNDTKK
jgi:hypothetical protein